MHITLAYLRQTFSLGKRCYQETASQSFYVRCRLRTWDKYAGTVDLFVYQTIVYKSPLIHFVNFEKAYLFEDTFENDNQDVRLTPNVSTSSSSFDSELSPPRYNVGGSKSTLLG